ncbi:hypothetical protein EDB83DRAFT_2509368 [Lactarius deliciosus]|nr:hypothetical protein EDB83DRAFT_2509368 [Lactarius deliciosus]
MSTARTQDGKKVPAMRVALPKLLEGGAQVRLKFGLENDCNGHDLAFTSPRSRLSAQLTTIISNKRSTLAWRPNAHLFSHCSSAVPAPAPSRPSNPKCRVRFESSGDPCERRFLHLNTPDLAALHRELVVSGQVTETEFWEGREHLLLARAASDSQKKRRLGQLGGENKTVIAPQLVHDVFDEYPVVAKAYDETCRAKYPSQTFYSRRASIRSTATQHVVKDEAIFDKCLEKLDDELEPRRPRDDEVDMFIDPETTRGDHEAGSSLRDVTIQARKQRGALPLIRKSNEHSERLLKSTIAVLCVLLEMQDRQRYFESRAGAAASAEQAPRPAVDLRDAWQQMRRDLDGWQRHLAQLKTDRKAAEAALASMTENVATRLDAQKCKTDIPEEEFGQMQSTLGGPTTFAQKTAKATRMAAGYLTKMSEKFGVIVRAAEMAGVDQSRAQTGMQPTMDAAKRALEFWETRKAAPDAGRA